MRLNRRSGRNNGSGKWRLITIVLTLTMAFGLMGTAAAYWSDSIFINAKDITTGSMQVWFPLKIENEISNAFIDADVDKYSTDPPQHELYLTVKKVPNNKFVQINFKIENIGSVPAALGEPYMTQVDLDPVTNVESFTLTNWNLPDRVDYDKTNTGHFRLNINATTPGTYDFEAVIPARAWNQLGTGGWTDELYVKGQVTIVEDENPGNGNQGNGNSGNGNQGNGPDTVEPLE